MLLNDVDLRYRVDFHPAVARFSVPDVGAENPNSLALLRYIHIGVKVATRGHILRKAAEGEYVTNVEEMEFLPGSAEAIAKLSRSGFKIIVVTNQRGVATGKIQFPDLEDINVRMRQTVANLGGEVCDVF